MTFTNGDAYRAIGNQLKSISAEMRMNTIAYDSNDLDEREFMFAMTACMKRFTAMYDLLRNMSDMFETIERYI